MIAASLTWLRAQTQTPKGEPVDREVVVRTDQIRALLDEREALLKALELAEEWVDIEQRTHGKGVDEDLDLVVDAAKSALAKAGAA